MHFIPSLCLTAPTRTLLITRPPAFATNGERERHTPHTSWARTSGPGPTDVLMAFRWRTPRRRDTRAPLQLPQRRAGTRRRQASAASLRRRSPSRPEMLDQAVPVELASAPHVDAGAVYDQEQVSNVSDADIHVVVTPNEVQ